MKFTHSFESSGPVRNVAIDDLGARFRVGKADPGEDGADGPFLSVAQHEPLAYQIARALPLSCWMRPGPGGRVEQCEIAQIMSVSRDGDHEPRRHCQV